MIRIYNSEMKYIADTSNYSNLIVTSDLTKGYQVLEFDIIYDSDISYFKEENKIEYNNYYYVIKDIATTDNKHHIVAMPYYSDLNNIIIDMIVAPNINLENIINMLLANSEWSYEIRETVYGAYSFTFEQITVYDALQQIKQSYNIEMWYSTKDKILIIGNSNNSEQPKSIIKTGDMITCNYKGTTQKIVTKLYPIGANNIDIAIVNNGKPYIEDYSYTKEKIVGYYINTNITDPNELMKIAQHTLFTVSKPQRNYSITVKNNDIYKLGDIVRIIDTNRGIDIQLRINKIVRNSTKPEELQLELGVPINSYVDVLTSYINDNNNINRYILRELAQLTNKMEGNTP